MSWFWSRKQQEQQEEDEEYEDDSEDEGDYDDEDKDHRNVITAPSPIAPMPPTSEHSAGGGASFAQSDVVMSDHSDEDSQQQQHQQQHRQDGASFMYEDYSDGGRPTDLDDDDDAIVKGVIPEAVEVSTNSDHYSTRARADSAITLGEEDSDDEEENVEVPLVDSHNDSSHANVSTTPQSKGSSLPNDDEEEEVTTTAEKLSLLLLAAEHDRVDILQAILSDTDRESLLREGIPPLHIAVSYGSVNATNCLMRMGADPSIRPNVPAILAARSTQNDAATPSVEIPNLGRFDGASAWELVFGDGTSHSRTTSWRLFGGNASNLDDLSDSNQSSNHTPKRRKPVKPIDMAPSKREGIRHAFTAEALRCIGSDEVGRLQQLIDSGMPSTIDIGGKNLYDWAVEMGALKCEELLRPAEAARHDTLSSQELSHDELVETTDGGRNNGLVRKTSSSVLDRGAPGHETIQQLLNRLDELDSLGTALSISLDGLAEEVSVCNGLLLLGGGASALAAHVRSLKATKERKMEELQRINDTWENSEDELAYWVRESGEEGQKIASQFIVSPEDLSRTRSFSVLPGPPEEEEAQRRQCKGQIAASEHKVRKLRASIADLSEALDRDLEEVQRRGLAGGINLVRGLREEIREIEFRLSEAKSAEATVRTKISLIQSKLLSPRRQSRIDESAVQAASQIQPAALSNGDNGPKRPPNGESSSEVAPNANGSAPHASEGLGVGKAQSQHLTQADALVSDPPAVVSASESESDRIARGQSTAIAVRNSGRQGFFPLSLWQILLRIIGFGGESEQVPRSGNSSGGHHVMLI